MLVMPVRANSAYIPPDQELLLVDSLERVKDRILSCAQRVLDITHDRLRTGRLAQFVTLVLVQNVLGLPPGTLHLTMRSPSFSRMREWISGLDKGYPGESTGFPHFRDINEHAKQEIEQLAENVQDEFQQKVGATAREKFTSISKKRRLKMVPGPECFIGIEVPSDLLGTFPVFERGVILPFLNAWIYMQGRKITSRNEFIGMLKTPTIEGDSVEFRLAGTLGFYLAPPGKNEIFHRFRQVEEILSARNVDLSIKLVNAGIMEMTVVSIDTTNIPVDKKDKTGSKGTGSRGTFFGHKEATSTDVNCIPVAGSLHGGRAGDVAMFDDVFEPVKEVLKETGQDMWATDVDAGFSGTDVVDKIEAAGAVPFVNVNPKRSTLLKALVTSAEALDELSTKAFNGLELEERQSWRAKLQAISAASNGPIPLDEKKRILKKELQNLGARALRKGLDKVERWEERRLRGVVMQARRDIRYHGTDAEKRIGLTTIALGTVEWKLVYATRGQNEGINSILKKRGSIIGDGQHTSWSHGNAALAPRCNGAIAGIKIVALVASKITGNLQHTLGWMHNWHVQVNIFVIVKIVILYRVTPDINRLRAGLLMYSIIIFEIFCELDLYTNESLINWNTDAMGFNYSHSNPSYLDYNKPIDLNFVPIC
jgi:hypothetical protein